MLTAGGECQDYMQQLRLALTRTEGFMTRINILLQSPNGR
jgi:hypothetical protein